MTLKLTPQKAAELLKELQYAKVQMGGQLSIRDEYFKQALEQLPRWIACSEKLPNESGRYLCILGAVPGSESQMIMCDTQMGSGDWDDVEGDSWYSYESGQITHWMPLPEAPL